MNNEKYCGNVLCQKTYTVDFLTGDVRKNKGELPQYFIEDNHPAIITKEVFRQVQEEMLKRASVYKPKEKMGRYSSKYALSGKVIGMRCALPKNHMDEQGKGEENRVALYKGWRTGEKLQGITLCTGEGAEKCGTGATRKETVWT